jgi:DNA-directed RNA polymerase specialized sigma24 family protein
MHDARDAEDKRLLETGEHKLLVSGYFHWVRERCFLRLRDPDAADDAAQRIFLRLLSELRDGKTYRVPHPWSS